MSQSLKYSSILEMGISSTLFSILTKKKRIIEVAKPPAKTEKVTHGVALRLRLFMIFFKNLLNSFFGKDSVLLSYP